MDASILKYMAFVQTIECGSFTRAAELLNYSQSGISRMIGDLEKDWRVSLLVRNRTGVTLTSEGMRLLPYARSVCEEYRKLQMQVEELNGLQSGLIRIGTISSIAAHWLPNVIAAFQKEYPNVAYELLLGHYADIEAWVNEGRVDVGFTRLPAQTDLEAVFLNRTSCSWSCRNSIRLPPAAGFRPLPWRIIPLCCLKREKKRIFRKSSSAAALRRISILQRLMITPSCRWWKRGWASAYCPN